MPGFATKHENLSRSPGITVTKPVNKLFANAIDYRNYRLITKLALHLDETPNKLTIHKVASMF